MENREQKLHLFKNKILLQADKKGHGTNQNFLELLNQNYELGEQIKQYQSKCDILKNFILQNDDSYGYKELRMIFQKLGNIFSKNNEMKAMFQSRLDLVQAETKPNIRKQLTPVGRHKPSKSA